MGGTDQTGDVETTALVTLAFLRANSHLDLAQAALATLVQQKDSFGTWYNTSATVMALKALLASLRGGTENTNATVTVTLNGGQAHTVTLTPDNAGMLHLLTFDDLRPGGANHLSIQMAGQGNVMYQATTEYYVPWSTVTPDPAAPEAVAIQVAYDRTQLTVDDTVAVNVTVTLNTPGSADQALIDLGVPPGFAVQTADLDVLVAQSQGQGAGATIERYELTGRQVLVYLRNLRSGEPLAFQYHLQARFPLTAQTPASQVYDYYNPGVAGQAAPQQLVVRP
jgi:uncharacterized protein YfaS (alpha-2-macroglobulin family)